MTVWMTDTFFESTNIGYDTVTEKEKRPFWKRILIIDDDLTLHYQPLIASTIASFITIIGYLAVADSMAYLTRLFKKP
jgi:hypothetical protein